MKPLRFIGFIFVLVLLVVLVGPLIIPIPPLPEPIPVEDLADSDSRFIEVNSIDVHYKMAGSGEPVMILLHGFASSTYSWEKVTPALAEIGTVISYDRPAFGLTERPMPGDWTGDSPYSDESQVSLLTALMDGLGIDHAVLVGHSAGAAIALQTAFQYPSRVSGLVLVDPAISSQAGIPALANLLMDTPYLERLGPYFSRSAAGKEGETFLEASWYDPDKITEEIKEAYRKPLQVANWDVALWEFTKAERGTDLDSKLDQITQPVLVVSGVNDRIVPPELSQGLANSLPAANFLLFSSCGHVPQEECPDQFLPPVLDYIQGISE